MSDRLIRLPEVISLVGLGKTEIYKRIKAGTFPEQRRLSHKVAVWTLSEVAAWVQQQVKSDA